MPNREVHLRRWQLVGIFLLIVGSAVFAVYLVDQESKARSSANRELIFQQERQRAEITLTNCIDQNERHDKTIMRLDEILARAQDGGTISGDAVRRSRESTIFIIEALAPHQNCEQVVLDRFGYVPVLPTPDGEE